MEQGIQGNGEMRSERDLEFKYGWMGLSMKETGRMIKLMARESSIMRMETFMMGSGETIKLMEKEPIHMPMERLIKVTGLMTNKMDTELRHGQMEPDMRAITKKEKSMGREN